jgi:hypothetical protein
MERAAMSFLKPKAATSSSENVNRGLITSTYSPAMTQGLGAQGVLAGALGVPGSDPSAATAGFDAYRTASGFDNILERAMRGVTGGQAAGGLLRSGSTGNAYLTRANELTQQSYGNYLQNLTGLSSLGLNAGNLVANAGQTSQSVGGRPSTAGSVASTIGGIASIFSDRRLKTDIEQIRTLEDGLGVYRFRYLGQLQHNIGVMADEVAKFRPWALGPKIAGFATVNYGNL